MNHTHPDPHRLHAGCDACLDIVRRDQFRAEATTMSVEQLTEALMARDHIVDDWRAEILRAELDRRPTYGEVA